VNDWRTSSPTLNRPIFHMISRMKLGTVLICLFRYEFSNQTNSHKKSHCVNIEISAYDKSYEKSYEKADSVNFTLRSVPQYEHFSNFSFMLVTNDYF
jgi:hypothetical protein